VKPTPKAVNKPSPHFIVHGLDKPGGFTTVSKNVEVQRTYTIQCGEPRTLYHCAPCARTFSETRHTPIAQLKTPIARVVQVLAALTEGVGINAATRLYGVSKNSIYRWQERLSGLKKPSSCSP
jgi:transposase-like protein